MGIRIVYTQLKRYLMLKKEFCHAYVAMALALSLFGHCSWAADHVKYADIITDSTFLIGKQPFGDRPVTIAEFKALDPLCRLILANYVSDIKFWLNTRDPHPILRKKEFQMGLKADWMHHYCHGQLAKFRYFTAKTKNISDGSLIAWQTESNYSVNGIFAMPEYAYKHVIIAELAESLYYRKNYREAIFNAQKAIKFNKQYMKGYRVLAESLIQSGEPDKALDVIASGLKIFPNSGPLKNLYAEATTSKRSHLGSSATTEAGTK